MLAQASGHLFKDGVPSSGRHLLSQLRDSQSARPFDQAVIRLESSLKQPQQSRLARSVAAHQADPFARLDLQTDAIEQTRAAVAEGDIS